MVVNETLQVEDGRAIYDKGGGSQAFDGQNLVMGVETMGNNGALRLVKDVGGQILGYDQNGNLTNKVVYGAAYLFSYDAENRLTGVSGKTSA